MDEEYVKLLNDHNLREYLSHLESRCQRLGKRGWIIDELSAARDEIVRRGL